MQRHAKEGCEYDVIIIRQHQAFLLKQKMDKRLDKPVAVTNIVKVMEQKKTLNDIGAL